MKDFEDETFDCVIDKGTLDCVLVKNLILFIFYLNNL